MKRASFVLFLTLLAGTTAFASARDNKLDAQPAGLTPSSATVSQVLKAYDTAIGKRDGSLANTSSEVWSFNRAGLTGTETLLRSGNDFYSRIAAGPLVEEYGQFVGHSWHRDFNGVVSPVSAPQLTSFEMLLFMDELNDASNPKNDVKVIGEVSDPRPAYVLSLKEPGSHHPEFLYYDKQSGYLNKVSYVVDDERWTISYDDYRRTKGLAQPWHVRVSDGTVSLDDDFKRTSLALGTPVDTMRFITPASTMTFATYSGTVKLPAKVVFDTFEFDVGGGMVHDADSPTLIVRVDINGRGLDFAVSSGTSTSLIDSDVAQQLGLPTYGQTTHAKGDAVAYDTIIPSANIGGLALRNFAVRALPFHYHPNDETKVVGVLGFDVLSAGAYKIDFDNGTLELHPAHDFDQTDLMNDPTSMLPIVFDDGYPFVQGMLASHATPNVLVDNDFMVSFLSGDFITEYPGTISDEVTGKQHGSATVPFADSNGYGRDVSIFMSKIPDLQVGPAHFIKYEIIATDGLSDVGGRTTDAVLGGDVLKYYDMYLDYPHNRMFLRPNKLFFKDFKIQ